ncbi:protein of unknown function [Xenorhabdus doucetiae]|uniref:DDE superfamily endonuclease n=1 Tax=Xenorhabdus doucetiae TaxID=351671 RepID=A0A068QN95_9GAMM|nr:DDE superfamily endonuclease [Xenorhabdus doucetiae]CDG16363.1 protein of unknown function [Xenorhabdus doucetiae]
MVTIDKSGADKTVEDELNQVKSNNYAIVIRKNKYLNNLIEQEHRFVKRRTRPMLGFKNFRRSQTVLAGIELVNILRKRQYSQRSENPISPVAFFYQPTTQNLTNPAFLRTIILNATEPLQNTL